MMHGLCNAVELHVLSQNGRACTNFRMLSGIVACACGIFARMILMYVVSDDRQGKAVDKIQNTADCWMK